MNDDDPREPGTPRPDEAADPDEAVESGETGETGETEWQRRRRLAAVFGDVLPDTTSDERDPEAPRDEDGDAKDRWHRSQVPPHHG